MSENRISAPGILLSSYKAKLGQFIPNAGIQFNLGARGKELPVPQGKELIPLWLGKINRFPPELPSFWGWKGPFSNPFGKETWQPAGAQFSFPRAQFGNFPSQGGNPGGFWADPSFQRAKFPQFIFPIWPPGGNPKGFQGLTQRGKVTQGSPGIQQPFNFFSFLGGARATPLGPRVPTLGFGHNGGKTETQPVLPKRKGPWAPPSLHNFPPKNRSCGRPGLKRFH